MKRLTAMFSLLLCVVLLCTSCGASSMTFEELYSENKYEDKYPTLGSISEIPTLEGFMHVPGEYENETQILAFRNQDRKAAHRVLHTHKARQEAYRKR